MANNNNNNKNKKEVEAPSVKEDVSNKEEETPKQQVQVKLIIINN